MSATNGGYDAAQMSEMIDLLISMNVELGVDAANAAINLGGGDINHGQFVIDNAFASAPVCRHLLNGGCYRSDCTFSHDVDEHTCLFWLRGVCTKTDCQFFHG
tara:strand:+ start:224 stop:532 length:309 start_codon:yes stop_codon:yes gene_type:complete